MNKFVQTLNAIRFNLNDETRGYFEVLAFVSAREQDGLATNITDLVRSHVFGTGPTVHAKVTALGNMKLLSVLKSLSDARAKSLYVTQKGKKQLEELNKEIMGE